ncbi:hypothetical protein AYI69_g10059 [Smittium culicis]|uniref:Uncharacterized protein n=1 Tax=Smittium culicis TaxID=133412 RepID=A0A1R1X8C7_9FUNG|nr:hypothetical protein AYI69_g10059 [Smittium culicis]
MSTETGYKRRLRSSQVDSFKNEDAVEWDPNRPLSFKKTYNEPQKIEFDKSDINEPINDIKYFKDTGVCDGSIRDTSRSYYKNYSYENLNLLNNRLNALTEKNEINSEIPVAYSDKLFEVSENKTQRISSLIPSSISNYESILNNKIFENSKSNSKTRKDIIDEVFSNNDNKNYRNDIFTKHYNNTRSDTKDSFWKDDNSFFNSEITETRPEKTASRDLEDELLREMELELAELDTGNVNFTFNQSMYENPQNAGNIYTKDRINSLTEKKSSSPEIKESEIHSNKRIEDKITCNNFDLDSEREIKNINYYNRPSNLFSTPNTFGEKQDSSFIGNSIYKSFLTSENSLNSTDAKIPPRPPKMP